MGAAAWRFGVRYAVMRNTAYKIVPKSRSVLESVIFELEVVSRIFRTFVLAAQQSGSR